MDGFGKLPFLACSNIRRASPLKHVLRINAKSKTAISCPVNLRQKYSSSSISLMVVSHRFERLGYTKPVLLQQLVFFFTPARQCLPGYQMQAAGVRHC